MRIRRFLLLFAAMACLAPTPGDIGGCGRAPILLDGPLFFAAKRDIDCAACVDCNVQTVFCKTLCENGLEPTEDFPAACFPLTHDGEVCLRALESAGCDEYRTFLRDEAPAIPTECNFCPEQ